MKAVLISINKPHTDNIFNSIKRIEWRTKPMPTGTHYCYETKNKGGCGKVIGEFKIWRVRRYENVSHIPDDYITLGCVMREHLTHYSGYSKHKPLYAHFIVDPIKYDTPKELSEFYLACNKPSGTDCSVCIDHKENRCKSITRPPQSWCYVEELR